MPILRPSQLEDAYRLAPNLREADLQEIQALSGLPPEQALLWGIKQSEIPVTVEDEDGEIIAIFGVVPDDPEINSGIIWLLGSDRLFKHRKQFIKESKHWIEVLQRQYKLLYNFVDCRNTVHIKWLEWCGFIFLRCVKNYGIEQRPFLEFVKVRG